MTAQLEALDALIVAVEAGTDDIDYFPACGCSTYRNWIVEAYNGSLDAAHRLHDALLPGWIMWSDTTGFAQIYKDEMEVTASHTALVPGKRARAELIAILHAYRTTLETKP